MKNLTSNLKYIFVIILSLLYIGCGSEETEEMTESSSELEPLVYTLYSDKTELFVEFKPLITGTESKFAAHFTHLGKTFKAFTEGSVTVRLKIGDNEISETSTAPSSPGIFRLALTPEVQGKGQLIFDITSGNSSDQIIIDDITVYDDEGSAYFDQKEGGDEGDVVYLKEQAWKVDFANQPVIRETISEVIRTSGQILSAPGDEILVSAIARGTVDFASNDLLVGRSVNQGASLFTITSGDFSEGNIDTRFEEARALFEKTEADMERAGELVKDKIISEKEYREIFLRYENAKIMYDAISKNYSSGGQTISAPMSGYIKNVLIAEGQFVEPGTPLMTISKNRRLILQTNLSQKYFDKLPLINSANFKTNSSEETYSTDELGGRKISYGKSIDTRSVFIPVIFEIDNAFNFIPGSAVEVYLKSSRIPGALVIPYSSLLEEQGHFFVYVQTEGESFQKRQVELGISDGINVQVLSGLEVGERVVSVGAYQIKLASMSGTMPAHGHEH